MDSIAISLVGFVVMAAVFGGLIRLLTRVGGRGSSSGADTSDRRNEAGYYPMSSDSGDGTYDQGHHHHSDGSGLPEASDGCDTAGDRDAGCDSGGGDSGGGDGGGGDGGGGGD